MEGFKSFEQPAEEPQQPEQKPEVPAEQPENPELSKQPEQQESKPESGEKLLKDQLEQMYGKSLEELYREDVMNGRYPSKEESY